MDGRPPSARKCAEVVEVLHLSAALQEHERLLGEVRSLTFDLQDFEAWVALSNPPSLQEHDELRGKVGCPTSKWQHVGEVFIANTDPSIYEAQPLGSRALWCLNHLNRWELRLVPPVASFVFDAFDALEYHLHFQALLQQARLEETLRETKNRLKALSARIAAIFRVRNSPTCRRAFAVIQSAWFPVHGAHPPRSAGSCLNTELPGGAPLAFA